MDTSIPNEPIYIKVPPAAAYDTPTELLAFDVHARALAAAGRTAHADRELLR